MKILSSLLIAATISLLSPLASAATPTEEILQLEKTINAAYEKNDLPTYFSYYADDFRGMFPDGPTSLAQYRREWTASVAAGNVLIRFSYGDIVVQVSPSGDAAVASYRATARVRYGDKAPVDENYFETDVFFKRPEGWKLVEVHYATAPDKH